MDKHIIRSLLDVSLYLVITIVTCDAVLKTNHSKRESSVACDVKADESP